nr:hypothetical protein [Janthinobacterium sp. HH01]
MNDREDDDGIAFHFVNQATVKYHALSYRWVDCLGSHDAKMWESVQVIGSRDDLLDYLGCIRRRILRYPNCYRFEILGRRLRPNYPSSHLLRRRLTSSGESVPSTFTRPSLLSILAST